MSLKVKYLDIRKIKQLRKDIEYIGSNELKNELNDYISYTRNGNYLCNILNDNNLLELEKLKKDYRILSLI